MPCIRFAVSLCIPLSLRRCPSARRQVLLVDTGVMETLPLDSVQLLPPELVRTPVQCFQVSDPSLCVCVWVGRGC